MRIKYYDLKHEQSTDRLPTLIGREEELMRITRTIARNFNHHLLVVGEQGLGKTTLLRGWVKQVLLTVQFPNFEFIEFGPQSFYQLQQTQNFTNFETAIGSLPQAVIICDNFGELWRNNENLWQQLHRLLSSIIESRIHRLILSCTPSDLMGIYGDEAFLSNFEVLTLKAQPYEKVKAIAYNTLKKLHPESDVPADIIERTLEFCKRFPTLAPTPQKLILLLDEVVVLANISKSPLTQNHLARVVAEKLNIPEEHLTQSETEKLKILPKLLDAKIIGQKNALKIISQNVTRAKLGLKNHNRPLTTFLALGPSGVGKTETAKTVAELIFGSVKHFVRMDMSEFGEAHTVQRILGAPPGYIGFESGGGLTEPIKREPFSLVLLDEIEKAHPKIFDVFLQVLDDGRLTDGRGETVDFTQTIIMATSNSATEAIITGYKQGKNIWSREFYELSILPELTKLFRLEFLNRFDSVLIFKPLDPEDLLRIAELEIRKVQERVTSLGLRFAFDPKVLIEKIQNFADPRFGARPVKRFIEETCETLVTEKLLKD